MSEIVRKKMEEKSEAQLLHILQNEHQFRPEAIRIAKEVLEEKRNASIIEESRDEEPNNSNSNPTLFFNLFLKPEVPWYFRLNRILALVVCLPAALYVIIGTVIPNHNIEERVVIDKEIGSYTVKSEEYTSYLLKTEEKDIGVPPTFYHMAEVGDTLRLKTGISDIAGYHLIELIQNGESKARITDDALQMMIPLAGMLLFPLLIFTNYENWKDNIILRVLYGAVPSTISLGVIFFLFVAWLVS
ncbi:hypothetical protein [Gracilimonas sp.]|uniref:hypothetical protein n=1 Tax=Gracilimonas sp. TaxID=1974203 RepID=UPI003D12C9EC